jgi:hypothetical protein
VWVVVQLGQIELALLFVLMLCLALLDTPVPRVLALPAVRARGDVHGGARCDGR